MRISCLSIRHHEWPWTVTGRSTHVDITVPGRVSTHGLTHEQATVAVMVAAAFIATASNANELTRAPLTCAPKGVCGLSGQFGLVPANADHEPKPFARHIHRAMPPASPPKPKLPSLRDDEHAGQRTDLNACTTFRSISARASTLCSGVTFHSRRPQAGMSRTMRSASSFDGGSIMNTNAWSPTGTPPASIFPSVLQPNHVLEMGDNGSFE